METIKKANRIPRKFDRIAGEMLIDTNLDQAGDKVYVYKTDMGYLRLNLRTQRYAYAPAPMLRDPQIFKVEEILVHTKEDKKPEISRWPDPEAQKTNDAKMEQTETPEEGEELEP